MFNIRWSGIAAVAAFIISTILGIAVGVQIVVILIRALSFAAAFFVLAALVWRVINRYLPELLQNPPSRDASFMPGAEPGSRVNITVGDVEIPYNAAVPPEDFSDEALGNITEAAQAGIRENAGIPPDDLPDGSPLSPLNPVSPPPVFAEGMDQSLSSRYTQQRDGVLAVPPANPASAGDIPGIPGLEGLSGGIESLPDLDALAGTFMSSGAAEEESDSTPNSPGAPEHRSKKGKEVGEDFNPKELASAIQTILKRD
ncbi:MAG: hypothetical protein LBP20_11300 [Treponema sp.]|nr:hypothetical protein [Treponema sp.]